MTSTGDLCIVVMTPRKKLSPEVVSELKFWLDKLDTDFKRDLRIADPVWTITSDSSNFGWGAWASSPGEDVLLPEIWGLWSQSDQRHHITFLETLAAVRALLKFVEALDLRNLTVLLRSDNLTCLSYLRKRVGKLRKFNSLLCKLWDVLEARHIVVVAEHIPGILNFIADAISRQKFDKTNYRLKSSLFQYVQKFFVGDKLQWDLFANHTNHLTDSYCYLPECDAFERNWGNMSNLWAHPPFALISRMLRKIEDENVSSIVVLLPVWPSQPWWPLATAMMTRLPLILPRNCLLVPESVRHYDNLRQSKWPVIVAELGSKTNRAHFQRLRQSGLSPKKLQRQCNHLAGKLRLTNDQLQTMLQDCDSLVSGLACL
eukprot:TRINITY_DN3911_c0_g1_i2.p2 TRINITY_DN3911_c0_g1~~TRINITY_DN3911_c0_g1_i2.p2  ORF type:complete len:373 (+),score=77.31 TRINITY_DN3911_c0_g1_i2:1617-2735(+)